MKEVSRLNEELEKRIKAWREKASDASRAARTDPHAIDPNTGLSNRDSAKKFEAERQQLSAHKKAIKNGTDYTPTALTAINPAQIGVLQNYSTRNKTMVNGTLRSITELEDNIIPEAKRKLEIEKRAVREGYIANIKLNKFINSMFKPEYSGYADDEAIHKIRMELKLDSGAKDH